MIDRKVGIVGTGPSALMAATILAQNGVKVILFDQKKAAARKFLVAGHGGFNLSNDENIESFLEQYDQAILKKAIRKFDNNSFRKFLLSICIETYVGSSGKIFPVKGIKPIEVLRKWTDHLQSLGAEFKMSHRLVDFDDHNLVFEYKKETLEFSFDFIVLALGGGSWSVTGSDASWVELIKHKGITCNPISASNSGFILSDSTIMTEFAGSFIKNCRMFSEIKEKKGDIVLTSYGIEGAPVYAMNRSYREGYTIYIDFKPDLSPETIKAKLHTSKNPSEGLKKLKLANGAIKWIKQSLSKEEFQDLEILSSRIKKMEIRVAGLRPVDEVISTVGGIDINEIDETFRLKKFPTVYCIGEMLNWDAPTGGYLIQGCVSSGYIAGKAIVDQS